MDIRVIQCHAYQEKERFVQKSNFILLSLVVSGAEYMNVLAPDGSPAGSAGNLSMVLVPPGFQLDFAFNAKRENYTALFSLDALAWNPVSRKIELRQRDRMLELEPVVSVPFERMNQL